MNKEELYHLYYECGLSQKEIAEKYSVTPANITYYFKKYGITSRNKSIPTELTKKQEQIILGSLLGTGSICKYKNGYSFKLGTNSKDSFDYKSKHLSDFIRSYPKNSRYSYSFETYSSPIFEDLYNKIYVNNRKSSTPFLLNNLSQFTLVMWALDSFNKEEFKLKTGLKILNLNEFQEKLKELKLDFKSTTSSSIIITNIKMFLYYAKILNIETNCFYNVDLHRFPFFEANKNEIDFLINSKPNSDGKNILHQSNFLSIPNSFMPHRFNYISREGNRSAMEWFNNKEDLDELIEKLGEKITTGKLRKLLTERGNTPGNFSPSAAKYIYQTYQGDCPNPVILDPCAGFGGRLFAAWCTLKEGVQSTYLGVEPNTLTYEGLNNLYQYLEDHWDRLEEPNKVELYHSPFEDWEDSTYEGEVDLVFTSPPYFNVERYGEESTQSYIRYPEYESWVNGFLRPLAEKSFRYLKSGGYFLINTKDVKTGKKHYPIYSDLKKIASDLGFEFVKEYNLDMGKAPYQKTKQVEKIGVWRKP